MINRAVSIDDINDVKNEVQVGDYIGFEYRSDFGIEPKLITGVVKEHHKNIFLLDNGHSYRWVDYVRGRIF